MQLIHNLIKKSSKIDKQKLLKTISFPEWKTFVYAYNPYAVYHLKFPNFNIKKLGEPNEALFKLLDDIIDGTIKGGLYARNKVEEFAREHGDLIKLIINKDLRCGVSATLFNSVHPNSIAQFKVQLAKEVPLIELQYPMLAQIKYDGVRIVALKSDGETKFYTRNGKEVSLPKMKEVLDKAPYNNFMLDGEMTLVSGKQEDRTKVSGMINSAMHGGHILEDQLRLNCFDFMPLSNFELGKCDYLYADRYSSLMSVLSDIRHDQFIPAVTVEIADAESANDYYQEVLEEGYEGLILKSTTHRYTFKRSKDWVKIKETKECDIKCIGWEEGKGKYAGIIGKLICQGIVEGKEVYVKVAGLSIMAAAVDPETNYIGRTIEVKYNAVILDTKTNQYSLFLPRFSRVRFDK